MLKHLVKRGYYRWRLKEMKRVKAENPKQVHFKLKMPRDDLIKIVEEAFKIYNEGELDDSEDGRRHHFKSIERTFKKVGQNPWCDDNSEFERHLSELSEDAMYKALLSNQKAQELCPHVAMGADQSRC